MGTSNLAGFTLLARPRRGKYSILCGFHRAKAVANVSGEIVDPLVTASDGWSINFGSRSLPC